MPQAGRNRLLWTFALALVLAALALLALPWIASTRIVADRLASELSELTGYQVKLGAQPRIEVWPSFKARLIAVELTPPPERPAAPVISAEEITGRLDAWAALRGDIRFESVAVRRPVATLSDLAGLAEMLDPLERSRIGRTVAEARAAFSAGTEPGLDGGAAASPVVTIEDGRIALANRPDAAMTGIAATLTWPRLDAPAHLALSGLWRGAEIKIDTTAGNGLAFLAGGKTRLDLSIGTGFGALAFAGQAERKSPVLAEGDIRFRTDSLKSSLSWLEAPASALSPDKPFGLEARLAKTGDRTKLDDVRLNMDGSTGVGAVEFDFNQKAPIMAGTLAFETVDLTPFVPAASARTLVAAGDMPTVPTGVTGQFVVDLRISAESARLGPVALAKTAATLNLSPELAAFDISDATALGGAVQAGFRSTPDGQAQITIHGAELDSALVAEAFGAGDLKPSGKASITAMLKGPAGDWRDLLSRGDGSISVKLADGAINGFNHALFRERLRAGGFFGLAEATGSGLPVRGAELRAEVSAGLARVEKCTVDSADAALSVNGIVPLPGSGLALSGVSIAAGDPNGEALPFFVGGSWSRPFFSAAPRP